MRLAIVALAASLAILAAVIVNLGGDGSELPLPAVIELQGKPPPEVPASALAAPIAPPAMPPPPAPAAEAAKQPPVSVAVPAAPKQALVNSRPARAAVAMAPLPAEGEVEEIRRYVSFSSTRDYESDCEEDEEWDPREEDCEEVDEAEVDDRDKPESDTDADDN